MLSASSLCILILAYFVSRAHQAEVGEVWSQTEFPTGSLIKSQGYPFESHEIETEDGYLITIHRIPHGKKNQDTTKRKPLVLMHGLLGSSENFMYMGKKSLCFMAAEEGYDVWLPNARGNMHSRKHKTLNPDVDSKFWEFSWHEIGVYDLPATIDYILNKTGQSDVQYVGHSQGSTVLLVMASERPEYKSKIKTFVGLAPAVYFQHFKHPSLKELLENSESLLGTLVDEKETFFFIKHTDFRNFGYILAQAYPTLYLEFIKYLFGDSEQISLKSIPLLAHTIPAGASTSQVAHYTQCYHLGSFRKFDYGTAKNLIKYNSTIPPLYDLKHMDIPSYLFAGQNDLFASTEDVHMLAQELPNLKGEYLVPVKLFTHFDFIVGRNIDKLINRKVLGIFNK